MDALTELPGSEDLVGGIIMCRLVDIRSAPVVLRDAADGREHSFETVWLTNMSPRSYQCEETVVDEIISVLRSSSSTIAEGVMFRPDPRFLPGLDPKIAAHYVGWEHSFRTATGRRCGAVLWRSDPHGPLKLWLKLWAK
jgi:hypothetical protein